MDEPGSLPSRVLSTVTRHPIVTGVLTIGTLAVLGLSVYIGLDLFFTVPILVMTAVLAVLAYRWWRGRQPADRPPAVAAAGRAGMACVVLAGVATFVLIQLVPYGRSHSNPPGSGEPQWATPRTRELMVAACYSCHSSEVEYPPYASVAPISWMVQRHVDEGREAVNYSDFATDPGEADESIEVIEEGEMPPAYFTRFGLHPEANLSDAELAELIAGLRATPGMSEGGERSGGGDDDGD